MVQEMRDHWSLSWFSGGSGVEPYHAKNFSDQEAAMADLLNLSSPEAAPAHSKPRSVSRATDMNALDLGDKTPTPRNRVTSLDPAKRKFSSPIPTRKELTLLDQVRVVIACPSLGLARGPLRLSGGSLPLHWEHDICEVFPLSLISAKGKLQGTKHRFIQRMYHSVRCGGKTNHFNAKAFHF